MNQFGVLSFFLMLIENFLSLPLFWRPYSILLPRWNYPKAWHFISFWNNRWNFQTGGKKQKRGRNEMEWMEVIRGECIFGVKWYKQTVCKCVEFLWKIVPLKCFQGSLAFELLAKLCYHVSRNAFVCSECQSFPDNWYPRERMNLLMLGTNR